VCLGQRMMLLRADPTRILSDFLCHVLNSPRVLAVVEELTGGTASPHLNVGEIRRFEVPLPPIDEQGEIVRRVDALFSVADAAEKRVAVATARAAAIPQSILTTAFSGDLVPTEAELARAEQRPYEPASVLLERIGTESGSSPARIRRARLCSAGGAQRARGRRPPAEGASTAQALGAVDGE
jgi:type I restriction enzyme, S subunit